MNKFGSAAQLAERYDVDASTIWRWSKSGILPSPVKISEGCTRFCIEACDERIAQRPLKPKDLSAAIDASVHSAKRHPKGRTRKAVPAQPRSTGAA